MRRQPGVSLFHPPARKPTVLRRYGMFGGIGLLAGATVGLGLTQMPVGQVAAVKPTPVKACDTSPPVGTGHDARCADNSALPAADDTPGTRGMCTRAHRCAKEVSSRRDAASPAHP